MLTEICDYLKNWFDSDQPKYYGTFTIENGAIVWESNDEPQTGQYYRIIGSVFNDGVWKYGTDTLTDEEPFDGAVWLMAVPKDLISLAKDISDWLTKYGGVDSASMSPYQSESFGGYSYSKGGSSEESGTSSGSWQSVFASRLRRWKKI